MDPLQQQVNVLATKVDVLQQQIVEQINQKIAEAVAEIKLATSHPASSIQPEALSRRYAYAGFSSRDLGMEHKDVLTDNNYPHVEEQSSERDLAPEIQIRRLTAQLTAAYNRIAALEEQLLSQRMH